MYPARAYSPLEPALGSVKQCGERPAARGHGPPTDGTHLLLEVKGLEDEQDRQKAAAARRWCDAVNAWGQMDRWAFETCRRREDVPAVLAREIGKAAPATAPGVG